VGVSSGDGVGDSSGSSVGVSVISVITPIVGRTVGRKVGFGVGVGVLVGAGAEVAGGEVGVGVEEGIGVGVGVIGVGVGKFWLIGGKVGPCACANALEGLPVSTKIIVISSARTRYILSETSEEIRCFIGYRIISYYTQIFLKKQQSLTGAKSI
jgi:hypothetical protein